MQTIPIEQYGELLDKKHEKLTALFAPFNAPALEVFASPPQHYRMRAEFRLWHDDGDLYHIMFDQHTRQRYRVDDFPIANELINRMMKALLPLLKEQQVLKHKLFQVDYLSTLSGEGFCVQLIGRATKQKICLERDYADEVLSVNGRDYVYRQVENSFTQPNAAVNCKMLEWAINCTQNSQGDLLELYCGNGNFSIALAQNFRKVLATEVAKPSVAAAQSNISANGVNNLQIVRMSAEEFTQAINGVRKFNRLNGIDLQSYECHTIFVDPPRAGLDPDTLLLVQNYDRILYISCNPHTLCDNLQTLSQTHYIERAALFDQFPYTEHMESGVWLIRK